MSNKFIEKDDKTYISVSDEAKECMSRLVEIAKEDNCMLVIYMEPRPALGNDDLDGTISEGVVMSTVTARWGLLKAIADKMGIDITMR